MTAPLHLRQTDHPKSIFGYAEAAVQAKSRVFVSTSAESLPPALARHVPEPAMRKLCQLIQHRQVIGRAWRRPDDELILVKTFSTTLMAVLWPLLWPHRRRLLLTVHHNLQYAVHRPHERMILRLLAKLGFRLALLECAAGLQDIGIDHAPAQFFVLRPPIHPAPIAATEGTRPAAGRARIGLVGELRPEKNSLALLRLLLEARDSGRLDAEIVLGCPNRAILEQWAGRGLELVHTAEYPTYLRTVASCDVLVVNYDAARYYHRHSGVLADAAGLGVPTVAPDFPTLRAQVMEPAPVGVLVKDASEIVAAIEQALELKRRSPGNFKQWLAARTPEAFACQLDAIVAASGQVAGSSRSPRTGACAKSDPA